MNQQLAQDLRVAKDLAKDHIINSTQLPDMVFRRLKKLNWLSEIIRGWYILKTPDVSDGESTLWYRNYWAFLKHYLQETYPAKNCLNPLSSIFLITESGVVPDQVVVMLKEGGSRTLHLPFGTSIMFYTEKSNFPEDIEIKNGINIISLPKALTMVPENFFSNYENEAEIALNMVKSAADLTRHLLDNHQPVKSDILAGAYAFLGREDFVKKISTDMELIAHTVRPRNPFVKERPTLTSSRIESPAVMRVEMLWQNFRDTLLKKFPEPDSHAKNLDEILKEVEQIYVHDAYNSLSIEGYAVTEELIQKVASGTFDAEASDADKKQEVAMAAKGYFLAFSEVKDFIKKNFGKDQTGIKYKNELQNWYAKLFTPKVQSGLAKPSLLTGYRNKPVYIRGSKHTPVNFSFVGDVMDKYLELLDKETSPKARALLGHFMLVYIHPFPDGNGRTARFLMNAVLVLSGYNWTVIRLENKKEYFQSLEQASVAGKIEEFAEFVAGEMRVSGKRV